jgi:hypothetical protein
MKYKKSKKISKKDKGSGFLNKRALLWLIFGTFLTGAVFFTIQISASGAVLADLEQKEGKFLKENDALKRELAKSTSLITIEEQASQIGFAKPERVIYISGEENVAKLP